MNFDSTIEAQIAGRLVRMDFLVELHFVSGTKRLWNGFGSLVTDDAKTWEGIAGLGSIEGLGTSINGSAPTQSFTLSGVDSTFAALAMGDRAEYYLRPAVTYMQFFDAGWQVLDNPYPITARQMTQVTAKRTVGPNGFVYTVSLSAETPFLTRRRPPYGFLTDRDQQRRFPNDRGLERVAGIESRQITWPDY